MLFRIMLWMTIDEFLQAIKKKAPPAPANKLAQLEGALGGSLPDDYLRSRIVATAMNASRTSDRTAA
jgi:hypothetical protein